MSLPAFLGGPRCQIGRIVEAKRLFLKAATREENLKPQREDEFLRAFAANSDDPYRLKCRFSRNRPAAENWKIAVLGASPGTPFSYFWRPEGGPFCAPLLAITASFEKGGFRAPTWNLVVF